MPLEKYSSLQEPELMEWVRLRDMELSNISDLPNLGYMYSHEGQGIAAGFLRLVEGGYAIMDSLITNPSKDSVIRHIAIDAVVSKLIEDAKSLKISKILAFSVDEGTLIRSQKHGFVKQAHSLITLEMGN